MGQAFLAVQYLDLRISLPGIQSLSVRLRGSSSPDHESANLYMNLQSYQMLIKLEMGLKQIRYLFFIFFWKFLPDNSDLNQCLPL